MVKLIGMKIIKEVRAKLGIKQCEIAKKIGVSKSNYCNVENGNRGTENLSKTYTLKAKDVIMPILEEKIEKSYNETKALIEIRERLENEN